MTADDFAKSAGAGVFRGVLINIMVHPLEVVRTNQVFTPEWSGAIAKRLWQDGGLKPFYKGVEPQLARTAIKQIWVWPLLMGVPQYTNRQNPSIQLLATAFSISTLDTILSPLEKLRIMAITSNKKSWSWSGAFTSWCRSSVAWTVFLESQNFLKERIKKERNLKFRDLLVIGAETALLVSMATSPFEVKNILKMSESKEKISFRKMFRGLPLQSLSLMIQSSASVILLDCLKK